MHNPVTGKKSIAFRLLLVIIIALLALSSSSFSQPGTADELTLKTVFLERFCRFVQWPDDALFADTARPFVIAVIGDPQMFASIERVYKTVRIRGQRVRVVSAGVESIPSCRVLFAGQNAAALVPDILRALKDRPVLIVGDSPGFARKGVHINMYTNQSRQIRFEVNNRALVTAGLHMSHLLLGLVQVIEPAGEEK